MLSPLCRRALLIMAAGQTQAHSIKIEAKIMAEQNAEENLEEVGENATENAPKQGININAKTNAFVRIDAWAILLGEKPIRR